MEMGRPVSHFRSEVYALRHGMICALLLRTCNDILPLFINPSTILISLAVPSDQLAGYLLKRFRTRCSEKL